MRTLIIKRPYMEGQDVRYCQRLLRHHGLSFVLETGKFDTPTLVGVRVFQSMLNLKPTGQVDDTTWLLLTGNTEVLASTVTGERSKFIDNCWKYVGVPYCHGGEHPIVGLDPLGFLTLVVSETWPNLWQRVNSLHEFLEVNCHQIPVCAAVPADVVVYSRDDGRSTHILVKLNDRFGIGPLGGNNSTTTPEMALKRQAFVKVKAINYRTGYQTVRFNNIKNSSE